MLCDVSVSFLSTFFEVMYMLLFRFFWLDASERRTKSNNAIALASSLLIVQTLDRCRLLSIWGRCVDLFELGLTISAF